MNLNLKQSMESLSREFRSLNWSHYNFETGETKNAISLWPGEAEEKIIICALKTNHIEEPFHRQDFFFLNYAYSGNCCVLSVKKDNEISINEGECYIGQPFSGYALEGCDDKDIIVIGILIQKDLFFHEYLPIISSNFSLLNFFLTPKANQFSEQFIHLSLNKSPIIRKILETMIIEYANRKDDTQNILKSLALTLFIYIAREYKLKNIKTSNISISEQIIQYISEHSEAVSLREIAEYFSYHPTYVSNLLHKSTGKTFSQILLEERMKKALMLLRGTTLTIEEIAPMIGYSNSSNFYKAFKEYYNASPREFSQTTLDFAGRNEQ